MAAVRRRDFLLAALALGGGLPLGRAARGGSGSIHTRGARPLRILVLGGTNYVGPRIVELALERGHEVTLFNRGITHPWLFTHLERLVGDRYPDRGNGLARLGERRRWDAVIDTWQQSPLCVQESALRLAERTDYYAYVSSVAVYQGDNYRRPVLTEEMALPPATMPTSTAAEIHYPQRKQLGEQVVAESFPLRHGIFRAYGMVGTDPRGRLDNPEFGMAHGCYWPIRLRRGGEVLAPGDGNDPTQWTDIRDLAEFIVHSLENHVTGTFNVSSCATMREYLDQLGGLSRADRVLNWVPVEFLFEAGLESFVDVPSWVSLREIESGFYRASTEKAVAAGLKPRSVAESFRPILDAFLQHHRDFDFQDPDHGVALARREAELLSAWREEASRGSRD